MKRNELKKLEKITFDEEIPLLDELYVVITNKRHETGYKTYKVYGVAHGEKRKITYAKCLSDCSDIINITPTFIRCYDNLHLSVLSIDSEEPNLFRMFIRGKNKIKVKFTLSNFEFEIVEV